MLGSLSASAAVALGERGRRRAVLVATILASAVVFLDGTVVNVALPAIQRDLGGGLTLQQWVVDAYLLTLGSLILLGGRLGDLYGERRVFLLGGTAFGVTSLVCAAAPTGTFLIVARGFQGGAGAVLTPAALATIAATFTGEERGAAIGTWTAWAGIGTVVGPLLGGWLVGALSWRSIFVLNVPLLLVTLALAAVAVPARTQRERPRLDVVGAVLCVVGLGGTVFALIEHAHRGWSDPGILATLVSGVVALVLFLAWERRTPSPMMPLGLFARRNFSASNAETFAVYAALSTTTFFLVLFLQQLNGYSAFRSGLALLPVTLALFALSRAIGRWSARLGPRLFMTLGPVLCAGGVALFARLDRGASYWVEIFPGVIAFALGLACIVAPLTTTVLAGVGEGETGIASGINNAVARIGGLLGIAAVGAIAAGKRGQLDVHGFHVAMIVTAGFLLVGGAIGFVAIRKVSP